MPYANPQTAAVSNRERQRRFRDRKREERRQAGVDASSGAAGRAAQQTPPTC